MKDRQFTHPNLGSEVRVETWGREVRLIFVTTDNGRAEDLTDYILDQLKNGALHLTLLGTPTSIEEE